MGMSLLDVQDLVVEFPNRHGTLRALDQVSFQIQAGEILGVVGESGAGKSLTGSAIIGLLQPPGRIAGGQIKLQGQRIDDLDPEALRRIRGRRIGAIFQDPLTSLNPLYTIGHQLIETIRTHLPLTVAQAKAKAIELLSDTGIAGAEQRLGHYPHQFSGGMRQRVVIALALAADPELIIADEPTTVILVVKGLDFFLDELLAAISRIVVEERMAAIIVEQSARKILPLTERAIILDRGTIVHEGPSPELAEDAVRLANLMGIAGTAGAH